MKWIRSETIAVLTVIVGMLAASASYSQNTNSGDIRGTVTDSSGAVVPGAIVTVLDLEKGVSKDFKTNSDGLFDTGPLVTGQYRVTFSHPGFGNFVRSSLTLDVQTVTINATLKPGEVTTEVVVTTDVPLIQTESGDQSRILDHREMQNLPNPNQDWENFVKLIPGATGTASYSSATGQALSINGNLPYNDVLNDGASSALSHSGNADVSIFESVQEVQVETSSFSAQYGIGGAIFNQISKSGTNKWHGSLYEYVQNDAFNARSYFQTTKPYLRFHNFGGAVSGPILKDKLFFYFNYDQVINQSATTGFATVPTEAMRNGDFSALATTIGHPVIYQPNTAAFVTLGGKQYIQRTPYLNQMLPVDPTALKVENTIIPGTKETLVPHPNVAGTVSSSSGITSNNYYFNLRGKNPFKKYFGRFDYDVTKNNRITGSVTKRDNPEYNVSNFPCPINCQSLDVDSTNAQITDVWNISSRTINEARFGYTNQLNFAIPQSLGIGLGTSLGLPYLKADIVPTINLTGYTSVSPNTNAIYKEHDYDPSDVVTMIRGHHVLHFGGEYLIFQDNSTAWGNINGSTVGFNGGYTQCTSCQQSTTVGGQGYSSTGNGYADFLLGDIQNWSAGVTPEFAGRQKAPQMFVQDDWKLKPNLTVNIGLRYQIMEGWSDAKKNQKTFDPLITNDATGTAGAEWYAATAAHGRTQLQNNVYSTFLPRFGFAWGWRPGGVIRGGYGLYAYLWSLDTYGGDEGSAFGNKGNISDSSNGYGYQNVPGAPVGTLGGANLNFPYIANSTANAAYNGQSVGYTDQNTPVTKIHQYNLTVEQQIGNNMSASLAYVGSHGMDLNFPVDINQVPASKLALVDQQFRPYPQFTSVTGSQFKGYSNYNSLQATMQRRMNRNVSFAASYVWSKFMDNFDSSAWGSRNGTTTYQSAYNPDANYGPSNFDTRNAVKGDLIVQLPFGHNQMFLNKNAFVDELIGGWQIASTFVLQSGNPFTVTVPTGVAQSYALSGNLYPNYVGNPNLATRTIKHWFNTTYVDQSGKAQGSDALPAYSAPANGTFGTAHRNDVYGPGLVVFDLSGGKIFNLWKETYKFQLRVDVTNVLNHPNFGLPNSSLSNGSVGTITSTIGGGRSMQLGGRFSF
jgi:hypothetical protein